MYYLYRIPLSADLLFAALKGDVDSFIYTVKAEHDLIRPEDVSSIESLLKEKRYSAFRDKLVAKIENEFNREEEHLWRTLCEVCEIAVPWPSSVSFLLH